LFGSENHFNLEFEKLLLKIVSSSGYINKINFRSQIEKRHR
jgi:hypothetical protein